MICSRLCRLFTQLPTVLVFGSILLAGPFSWHAQCMGGASVAILPDAERDSPTGQAQTPSQTQPPRTQPPQAPPQQAPPQQYNEHASLDPISNATRTPRAERSTLLFMMRGVR